jgi:hypothetical protein
VEHRLVGTGRDDLTQYSSSEQEPVRKARTVLGALLGPEGPGTSSTPQRRRPHLVMPDTGPFRADRPSDEPLAFRRAGTEPGVDLRPYLENCTVDASIFVAKLIRAHGGCLGTRSRRRT